LDSGFAALRRPGMTKSDSNVCIEHKIAKSVSEEAVEILFFPEKFPDLSEFSAGSLAAVRSGAGPTAFGILNDIRLSHRDRDCASMRRW
jgi:hypothetical protein